MTKDVGLYRKFNVSRTDPESQERHQNCRYFVLDIDHDEHAIPALLTYAESVKDTEPKLAEDLTYYAIRAQTLRTMKKDDE